MKGFVLALNHNRHRFIKRSRHSTAYNFSLKRFLSLYSLHIIFFIILILGICLGSLSFDDLSETFLKRLDFLFITNLDARSKMSAFDLFCSAFSVNFIFVFTAFLLSFCAFSVFLLPLLCAFKGFGIGLTSIYLFLKFGVTGIGFYILVILPGTVLFVFAFIIALKEAFSQSVLILKKLFIQNSDFILLKYMKTYLFRNFVVLIFTVFSALIDMMLWVLFANMFNF